MVIMITCYPVCDVINFVVNFSFLIRPFFYISKSYDKYLNILRTKRAFKMK